MLSSDNARRFKYRFPGRVFLLTLAIAMIGVLNLSSASSATRANLYLVQFVWFLCGCGIGVVLSFIQTRTIRLVAYLAHGFVIGLLLLVLVIGTTAKGGQRWIDLGFFNLQPSELAKISIVLVMARYLGDFETLRGYSLRDLVRPLNISRPLIAAAAAIYFWMSKDLQRHVSFLHDPSSMKAILFMIGTLLFVSIWILLAIWQLKQEGMHLRQLIAPVDLIALPFLLVVIEPDLATATIILAIAATMILFCGLRIGTLVIACIGVIGIALVSWNFVLKDYQRHRVESFLNPEADIRGKGYHAAQSIIAIGSGRLLGKGFGEGTQTQLSFLPENHTDFVFAVLCEEWGFIGASILVLLYLALVLSMFSIAKKAPDRFSALLAVGSASVIFWHVFVNIGMVTGLLPVAGVPLPLMSYGGSSMLTQLAAIALCINVMMWRQVK